MSSRARVVQITAKQVIYIVDMKTTAANDTNMESARVKPAKPLLFFVLLIMQVFDVLVVIACRACSCHYVRGKSGKDRQFYFPASSLARNADTCNVSYAGANKWGGLRTEAQFQGGQRTLFNDSAYEGKRKE